MRRRPVRLSPAMSPVSRARTPLRLLPALAFAAAAPVLFAADADSSPRPLPEARPFLESVRERLHTDETLLSAYTFTERHVQTKLDSKGKVKSTRTEVYEVYPSSKPGRIYRRRVMVDGKPVPEKELAEEDRKQEEKMERKRAARENETPEQTRLREEREAETLRAERDVVDELFKMDDIAVAGRETIDGRPTILVTFRPHSGYKPQTKGGKVLQKVAGKAWIDEDEKQLVRIDAELLDPLPVGPAGIFRLQKGAHAYFVRRRVNDEVWLPVEARFVGAAKILLFVLGRLDAHSYYSDYRKFSVSTSEQVESVDKTN